MLFVARLSVNSRNLFTYSSLLLGITGILAFLLNTGLSSIIADGASAHFVTSLILAFGAGAITTVGLTKFGVNLSSQAPNNHKELPPRKLFLSPSSRPATTSNDLAIPIATEIAEAPRTIIENGIARLLDEHRPKTAAIVEWVDYDTKEKRSVYRSIDIQTLRRFARLHTPARSEWSGKATTYSLCLSFFRYTEWVQTTGKGVEWADHYKKLTRRLTYLGDTAAISQMQSIPTQSRVV